MSPTFSNVDASTASPLLAACVAAAAERLQAGEQVDVQALCADCPEHLQQLQTLLPTLEAIVDLEQSLVADGANELPAHLANADRVSGVLGDFRILREIGRGGMGVVYEAEQISLGRRVALKVLPLAATLSTQQLQRFKNEARAAASLKHPHIVGVFSIGVERGVHYYAMELVEGHSLAQAIEEIRKAEGERRKDKSEIENRKSKNQNVPNPISPILNPQSEIDTSPVAALSTEHNENPQDYYRRAARLVVQAAGALAYAHSQGVVHRDIKPANLLIDGQSHLWITDFGLARLESDVGVTLTGDLLGTLRYMSPEQAAGKPEMIDYRTDIHALGATLYELLALQPAFDSGDRAELLRLIAEHEPPPLRKLLPGLPVDLETIALKAMEKEPVDRYQKAGELAADLQRFVEHRPITARPPTLAQRATKWSRRHRRLVWTGLALLLATTVALAIGGAAIYRAERATAQALVKAETQQTRAEQNLQLAIEALDQVYTGFMGLELQNQPALTPVREQFLTQVVEFYRRFAEQNRQQADDWPEVGRAYLLVGEVSAQLGHLEQAEDAFFKAMEVFGAIGAQQPDSQQARDLQAAALQALGQFYLETTAAGETPEMFTRAIQLMESSDTQEVSIPFPAGGASTSRPACLAGVYGDLAMALSRVEALGDAQIALSRALELMRPLVEADAHRATYSSQLANLFRQQAEVLSEQRAFDKAIAAMEEAIEHRQAELALDSVSVLGRRAERDDYKLLSRIYDRQDDSEQAVVALEKWRKLADDLARDYPLVLQDQRHAAIARAVLSIHYLQLGRTDQAEAVRQEFVALASELAVRHGEWEIYAVAASRAGVEAGRFGSMTGWKGATALQGPLPISRADAERILRLEYRLDAIMVSLHHDRFTEAQAHYQQAVALGDQLLESLTDPSARRFVEEKIGGLDGFAEQLSQVRSEE